MNFSELDTAWLAGLLEGEGCFFMACSPKIALSMTDEDIVRRVALMFGSAYRALKPRGTQRKVVYRTEIHGTKAIYGMEKILPLMGNRRTSKIKSVMELAAARPGLARGERSGSAKLSNADALAIRREHPLLRKRGANQILAKKYGVTSNAIGHVVLRKTFAHLSIL